MLVGCTLILPRHLETLQTAGHLRLPGVTIMTLKESSHPPREEPALVMNGETSVKSGACSGLSLASMALCTKSGHQNDKGVNSICYCTILQHLETSP
ncbi:hypothetical protein V5799_007447 [Amblyomma americanum]|uniref:Uncharacterized protein n=1 Tax=Amblyomma americanum TaxID=6943 RepID=A0AAQ4FGW5_AMBAM